MLLALFVASYSVGEALHSFALSVEPTNVVAGSSVAVAIEARVAVEVSVIVTFGGESVKLL